MRFLLSRVTIPFMDYMKGGVIMNLKFKEKEIELLLRAVSILGRFSGETEEKEGYLKLWKKLAPESNSEFVEAFIQGGAKTVVKEFEDGSVLVDIETPQN